MWLEHSPGRPRAFHSHAAQVTAGQCGVSNDITGINDPASEAAVTKPHAVTQHVGPTDITHSGVEPALPGPKTKSSSTRPVS